MYVALSKGGITILVSYTKEEQKALREIDAKERVAVAALHEERSQLLELTPPPVPPPELQDASLDPAEIERIRSEHQRLMEEWQLSIPPEINARRRELWEQEAALKRDNAMQRGEIHRAASDREFNKLGGVPGAILEDARDQVRRLLDYIIQGHKRTEQDASVKHFMAEDVLSLGSGLWKLDRAAVIKRLELELHRHREALQGQTDITGSSLIEQLDAFIADYLDNHPYVANASEKGAITWVTPPREIVRTSYPSIAMMPIDKVTKNAFAGELIGETRRLSMESRKSKKAITTLARVNFDAPQLQGIRNLNYYDRAVYNAIITLYVNGKNEYMTYAMIYQAMTGNPDALLTKAHKQGIHESVNKFMYGGIFIDATEEARSRKIDGSYIYDTNLLHAERVTQNLNGTITECIRLIRPPTLYAYAELKNQIGRIGMQALAVPVSNNQETVQLKVYLMDRIFAMRGSEQATREIAYGTIYNLLWGEEAGAVSRVKKARVRQYAAAMLDHWATEAGGSFIKSFQEYAIGKRPQGVRVSV